MLKKLFKTGIILVSLILIIALRYQIFFLRLPHRNIIENPNNFLSPANGRVIAIITGSDYPIVKNHRTVVEKAMEDTGTGSTIVSIMMTPLNVHYQRAPVSSTLISQTYHTGKFLNAMSNTLNATFENEYNEMLFETPDHIKFKVIQIAGFLARRIISFLSSGQITQQGDLIGLIKMGSQVSIVFDKNVNITTKLGDIVHEGESIIAIKKQ